jgi:hypothetical protein
MKLNNLYEKAAEILRKRAVRHQGEREKARRIRQVMAGQLTMAGTKDILDRAFEARLKEAA